MTVEPIPGASGRPDERSDSNSFLHAPESRPASPPAQRAHFERQHRAQDDSTPGGGFGAGLAQPPSTGGDAGGESGEKRRRRRGSRGGRRRRGGANASGARPDQSGQSGQSGQGARPGGDDGRPGEVREAGPDESRESRDEPRAQDQSGPVAIGDGPRTGKRRRRGGRGRRRKAEVEPGAPREDQAGPRAEPRAGARPEPRDGRRPDSQRSDGPRPEGPRSEGQRKRRRRGGRGRSRKAPIGSPVEIEAIPGEEDDLPELPDLPTDAVALPEEREEVERAEPARREAAPREDGRGSRRRRERGGRTEGAREAAKPARPLRKNLILVNAADPEEQRVAVVEDDHIVDFQMTVRTENSVVNDIYRGRVVNLETAIGAAFVDFGQGKNGFLHTSDVLSAYGEDDWSLDKLLSTSVDSEEWDVDGEKPERDEGGAAASNGDGDGEAPAEGEAEGETEQEPKAREGGRKRRPERTQRFRARPRLPISDLLKKGEMVVVQVTKDAIGDKGPTLTTYISIPGRYLVLMPSMSRTGVSRKIEDEKERKRLKKILESLDVPKNMGVIVRTAGVGRSQEDLKRDLDYLKGAWENLSRKLKHGNGPAPLYQESDVAIRTVRDLFTAETEAVVVDDPEVHRKILEFTRRLMPEAEDRVKLHEGPKPLFQTYAIEPDFERIFTRRLELPSGGSIVFDQAEALVAIDVNSGRTRGGSHDFEDVAVKTNLEAAPEIARQIRLRDLGGILVVDFIDMMKQANIRKVEKAFGDALQMDRARSKIGRISQFGLLELTRQRLGPGVSRKVFTTCNRCRGTGRIRTIESRAAAVIRRLGSALTLKGFAAVEVKAAPEVVAYLKRTCTEILRALEYRFERQIRLVEASDQQEDSVLRYLRADGREVRPGGRRKR